MRRFFVSVAIALLFWPLSDVQVPPYPSRPILFVIPFGPSSASDALARIAGQELRQALRQPIIVVHKPYAHGALSAIEVQRSAPARRGLPPEIVARMNKEMRIVLANPTIREQMEKHGFIPRTSSPEELAAYMKDQLVVWNKALKAAGIDPQ